MKRVQGQNYLVLFLSRSVVCGRELLCDVIDTLQHHFHFSFLLCCAVCLRILQLIIVVGCVVSLYIWSPTMFLLLLHNRTGVVYTTKLQE